MVTQVAGATQQWQRVTVDFQGPQLSETSSTFTDYRLNVTFRNEATGTTLVVPGFFAADGNAANSGADSGNVWRVYFNPPEDGSWTYEASFRTGNGVAASLSPTAGSPTAFDGETGSIQISQASTDPAQGDFHTGGMIVQEPGGHYLIHEGSGAPFIKAGADSPENFLAYTGFDNSYDYLGGFVHDFSPHLKDWNEGDPTWADGRGKEIIGAINYLAEKGINDQYFLTMNIQGDGKDVWPWISNDAADRLTYDVSKLDQWETVFEHMDDKGILLHVVTQETENDQLLGGLTEERMIYYRELVARFGHHNGVIWNVGEENTNSTAEQKAFADYIKALDPYDHPVDIHTYGGQQDEVFGPLLGYAAFDGASLQITDNVPAEVAKWVGKSAAAGDPWIVMWDETGPAQTGVLADNADGAAANHADRRAEMWGALTAGAAGVEWYLGQDDQLLEDYRTRDDVWTWTAAAKDFFQTYLPVSDMHQANALTSDTTGDDWVIAKPGSVYAIYLPSGGTATLDLQDHSGAFDVSWYNPRTGGALQDGSVTSVTAGGLVSLGTAPSDGSADWTILVRHAGDEPPPPPPPPPPPDIVSATGDVPDITTPGAIPDAVVTYAASGGHPIDPATIGTDDISISGPAPVTPAAVSTQVNDDGTVTATYSLTAPDPLPDGHYTVSTVAGAVTDVAGHAIDGAAFDTFDVAIAAAGSGTEGNDMLIGTSAADTLSGLGGVDQLFGAAGDDTLDGGAGRDKLFGGAGADLMSGGEGPDAYFVDDPGDRVVELAGGGIDEVNSYISYALNDNVENLRLRTAANIDGTGNDLDNRLLGNSGANQLDGGAGNDILSGSGGTDILIGGPGNDVFRYQAPSDSPSGTPDHIRDFTPGADRINLSAIDADSVAAGHQDFSFIGSAAFDGRAGELRFEPDAAGATVILGDLNGDGVAELEIRIDATVTLDQAAFVL